MTDNRKSQKFRINLREENDNGNVLESGKVLFKKKNNINNQAAEVVSPPKRARSDVANQSGSQSSQASPTTGTTNNQLGKASFAQTFAYLKNTDLYKLPPKPAADVAPQAQAQQIPKNTNAIIVNGRQRGNPILKHVKNVPWEFGEIIPDYQIGERHCVLFLSLRYHNLNPDYVHDRLKLLGNRYDLRVILVQVDIKNCKHNLKELGKMCLLASCTLILTWSAEEAGRYLETYKQYENKPPDILQERVETDYFAKIQDVLTTVKSINKTDAITLLSTFGSMQNIVSASREEIEVCPGFGKLKAQRLYKVFNEPFKRVNVNTVPIQHDPSAITSEANKSPITSTLKRPGEHGYLQKCISQNKEVSSPRKRKHNSGKDDSVSTKPPLLSLASSTIETVKSEDLQLTKEAVISSTKSDDNNIVPPACSPKEVYDEVVPKEGNSSIEQLVKQFFQSPPTADVVPPTKPGTSVNYVKDLQQSTKSSKSPSKSVHQHKMSKSEAVYKSGLSMSRHRKESEASKVPSHGSSIRKETKAPDVNTKHSEKRHGSSIRKYQEVSNDNINHLVERPSGENKQNGKEISKKIRSPPHSNSKQISPRIKSPQHDNSKQISSRISSPPHDNSKKAVHEERTITTVSNASTPDNLEKSVDSNSASRITKNLDPSTGKIKIGTHTRRESESATIDTSKEIFSQELTNDEFMDLLADADEDDDDYIF